MGPTHSATWHLMLDGAESILKEEGYAELTSRRLAERVGVKQQLVYYYFHTMDALMVEAFRRLAKRDVERLKEVLASDKPLHQFWEMRRHEGDARLISEFMALANRSEDVKKEVIDFIETTRRMQSAAIAKVIKAQQSDTGIAALPPGAITFLVTSVALALTRESALGISTAHAEIEKLIRECLAALEPSTPKPRRVSKRT